MAAFNYKQEYERYKKYYLSLTPVLNSSTNRAYTAVIFSFLAVSLFGWYAIRPTMETIFTLKREITDKTEVNKKMEDKITALIEAQAIFDNIQNVIPVLSQALPTNPEPIRALAQLRGLADEMSVNITGFTVPPVPLQEEKQLTTMITTSKIESIPITVTVTGPYAQIKQFLLGVSDLRRVTQVTSMSFTPRKETLSLSTESATPVTTGSGTPVQVDLKLNVFYVK